MSGKVATSFNLFNSIRERKKHILAQKKQKKKFKS